MISFRKKTLSLLLIFFLLVGIIGIVSVDSTYAASKKKTHIKTKTVSMYVGETYQQKLLSSKGKTIKAKKVKWKSKNSAVATINKKGLVKAVNAGEAKMTAKYKGKTYNFKVTVKKVMNNLLFDGIYVYPKTYEDGSITSYCLRFYEDGTVISVSTGGDYPGSWFNKDDARVSRGTYTLDSNGNIHMQITINNPESNPDNSEYMEYNGVISGKKLILDSYSTLTDNKEKGREYNYVPFSSIPNRD